MTEIHSPHQTHLSSNCNSWLQTHSGASRHKSRLEPCLVADLAKVLRGKSKMGKNLPRGKTQLPHCVRSVSGSRMAPLHKYFLTEPSFSSFSQTFPHRTLFLLSTVVTPSSGLHPYLQEHFVAMHFPGWIYWDISVSQQSLNT